MPLTTSEEKYDPEKKMPRREDSLEVIAELMREKGFSRVVRFDGSWEGDTLPGGTPNESGMIFTEDGRVFTYWLDWDSDKTAPDKTKGWYTLGENKLYEYEGETLPYFREIPPGNEEYPKLNDSSFIAAKKKLGLA
jgi:hypothetical protein